VQKDDKKAAQVIVTVADVKRLEEELRESKTALNNLLTLVEAARGKESAGAVAADEAWKVQMAALLALCRSCSRLMETGDLVPPGCVKPKEAGKGLNRQEIKESKDTLAVWMASTYKEVVNVALDLVQGEHVKGQLVAMRTVMGLVAREAETAAAMGCSPHVWTDGLFPALISSMLGSAHTSQQMLHSFSERYLDLYGDVRYYAWRSVAAFCSKKLAKEEGAGGLGSSGSTMARNAYDFMCLIQIPPTQERKEGKGDEKKVVHVVSMDMLVASSHALHTAPFDQSPAAPSTSTSSKKRSTAVDLHAKTGK